MEIDPEEVPMMYSAQVSGRCSLQFIRNKRHGKSHLEIWTEEWVNPQKGNSQPHYQHADVEEIIKEGCFCRIKMRFPFRVFTNCGQDSISRPVINGKGIPFIPGSSIKGLFLRYCRQRDCQEGENLTEEYCGSKNKAGLLRFYGAYPVGDWASTVRKDNSTSYRIVDVVHSQQNWQVRVDSKRNNAIATISLYQPTLVFEISSTKLLSEEDWKKIKGILRTALCPGLGGKTSTGYGLPPYPPKNNYNFSAYLDGKGITPVLLSREPEFRPNVFKATLRGHTQRLLAGCTNDEDKVNQKVGQLFGNTKAPSQVEIYWKYDPQPEWSSTYDINGTLSVSTPNQKDTNLIKFVFKFAYTMAGFGKSWRRVWHEKFYKLEHPNYDKLIGCHWYSDEDWLNDITTPEKLKDFLNELEKVCQNYLRDNSLKFLDWREAWHPKRVTVYSQEVKQSQVVDLFHDDIFKKTPAIGGRKEGDDTLKVSSVWHRMLPIGNSQYLEIVTLFHGDRSPWRHRDEGDQLPLFIKRIKKNLEFTWGTPEQEI